MHKGIGRHADDLGLDDSAAARRDFAVDRTEHVEGRGADGVLEVHRDLHAIPVRQVEAEGAQAPESSAPLADQASDLACRPDVHTLEENVPREKHVAGPHAGDAGGRVRHDRPRRLVRPSVRRKATREALEATPPQVGE
jgi:hypothetical protein